MINETILYLAATDCGNHRLGKYPELNIHLYQDMDNVHYEPLKQIFTRVIRYDFLKRYVEAGVRKVNQEIIDIVKAESPRYVLWPSMVYEIQEATFQEIRKEGTIVIGWFYDDECRFEFYSKWWIPYMDYCLTADRESVKKYRKYGGCSLPALVYSNPDYFRRLNLLKKYDVSFVGAKIADRSSLIAGLKARDVPVHAFGKDWDAGCVSFEEKVNIYNASKINLNFMKSYNTNAPPSLKCRIFDVCMCGGFLLSEYMPEIEDFYEIDKEIVCFRDIEEAADKAKYYLRHEAERERIAQAGWERAHRDHIMTKRLSGVFEEIEKKVRTRIHQGHLSSEVLEMPREIRRKPSGYHLRWAKVLMMEGYDRNRWQEELDLALSYDPKNMKALWLSRIGCLPTFIRFLLIQLLTLLGRFKRLLSILCYRLWVTHGARIFGRLFYGDWFYRASEFDNTNSHPVIARALAASLSPDCVVDFGCGDGGLLSEFATEGVKGIGYEFSKVALYRCHKKGMRAVKLDFRNKVLPSPSPRGSLVVCLEVAEHLYPRNADFLCDLLSCCEGSKWLVFSAATPGQGGEGHLNEQPHDYWRVKLEARCWRFNATLTKQQRTIWEEGGVAFYYWQNLQIFEQDQANT